MRPAALAALLFAVAIPTVASARPLRLAIDVPSLRARLSADPDVRIVAWGRDADAELTGRPLAPAGTRPALLLLPRAGGASPFAGIAPPGRLGAPAAVEWRGPQRHPLAAIAWGSSPQAAARPLRLPGSFRILAVAGDTPLLAEGTWRGRRVLVWTAPLDARPNRDLAAWPLLGYVLHAAALRTAGRPIEPLARWRAAPIPGARTARLGAAVLMFLWPLTLVAFARARRRSPVDPAIVARYAAPPDRPEWNDPSFARPLSGFFLFLAGSVLLIAPYFWIVTVIMPNQVQPFPQVDGIWGAIVVFFEVVFYLFDFATNTAFVRFFAATRVREPDRALRYAQLFLWWQVLSGLLQLTGIALVVLAGPLSTSTYALYGFFVLMHALVQYPGLFGVTYHVLQGAQRFDYASLIDVLEKRVFSILVPIPFVLLLRAWGRAHPAYGEVFGAVIGLGVGAYVTQWLTLAVGVALSRRAGLPVLPLFGASFGKGEVKDVFGYGARAIVGQVAYRAASSVEVLVLAALLPNYTEWLGIWGLLQSRFSYLVLLAYAFFDAGVPVFGEALGAGKRSLAQYLVARFLQFAVLWGAIVFAVLAALGPSFIRGALDAQWQRAAGLIVVAAFARALACPGWVSDALQRGANFPLLFSAVITAEQALRLALFAVMIPLFGPAGLFGAVVLSLSLKTVVAWWLNHRHVLPLRLSRWQSLGAPLLAGALLYGLLSGLVALVHPTSALAAQLTFYGGAAGAIVAAFFVLALVGGLDDDGLGEIDRASRMTSVLEPVARLFALGARAGARLSPLHGRYPQPAAREAHDEAAALATRPLRSG